MKRVMIIGQPGSGKSTLAAQLGEITGLPVYHIDREVHWKPEWVERAKEEKTPLCAAIHARQEWIFEGGHSTTWPERLARADTLIWLDFPLSIRLWRVIKRRLKYHNLPRPDMADNCPERLGLEFIKWIWNTRKTARALMQRTFSNCPSEKQSVHLKNVTDVANFIDRIRGL